MFLVSFISDVLFFIILSEILSRNCDILTNRKQIRFHDLQGNGQKKPPSQGGLWVLFSYYSLIKFFNQENIAFGTVDYAILKMKNMIPSPMILISKTSILRIKVSN